MWIGGSEFGWWDWQVRQLKWSLRFVLLTAASVLGAYLAFRALISLFKLTKPDTIDVFVVYQGRMVETARSVAAAMTKDGFNAHMLDLAPRDHDDLIDQVRRQLERASVVVAIPSGERGYFDAEIHTAGFLEKPIVFLAHPGHYVQPDTALEGHPVFDLASIERVGYSPLVRLIELSIDSRRAVEEDRRESQSMAWLWVTVIGFVAAATPVGFLMALVSRFSMIVAHLIGGPAGFEGAARAVSGFNAMFVPVLLGLFTLGCFFTSLRVRRKRRDVLRQRIRTRSATKQVLRELLAEGYAQDGIVSHLLSFEEKGHRSAV
jgi:hypothetical protein